MRRFVFCPGRPRFVDGFATHLIRIKTTSIAAIWSVTDRKEVATRVITAPEPLAGIRADAHGRGSASERTPEKTVGGSRLGAREEVALWRAARCRARSTSGTRRAARPGVRHGARRRTSGRPVAVDARHGGPSSRGSDVSRSSGPGRRACVRPDVGAVVDDAVAEEDEVGHRVSSLVGAPFQVAARRAARTAAADRTVTVVPKRSGEEGAQGDGEHLTSARSPRQDRRREERQVSTAAGTASRATFTHGGIVRRGWEEKIAADPRQDRDGRTRQHQGEEAVGHRSCSL